MNVPRPYTEVETIEIMMVETQNELTKSKILDRIYSRANLAGMKNDMQTGANQSNIKILTKALKDLNEIKSEIIKKQDELKIALDV